MSYLFYENYPDFGIFINDVWSYETSGSTAVCTISVLLVVPAKSSIAPMTREKSSYAGSAVALVFKAAVAKNSF